MGIYYYAVDWITHTWARTTDLQLLERWVKENELHPFSRRIISNESENLIKALLSVEENFIEVSLNEF